METKRLFRFVFCLVFILLWTGSFLGDEDTQENIIKNGGFEGEGGWNFGSWGEGDLKGEFTPDESYEGKYSARISGTRGAGNWVQGVKLAPHTDYKFSIMIKSKANEGEAYIFFWNRAANADIFQFRPQAGTSEWWQKEHAWFRFTRTFNSGELENAELFLRSGGKGTIWFDSVSLIPIPKRELSLKLDPSYYTHEREARVILRSRITDEKATLFPFTIYLKDKSGRMVSKRRGRISPEGEKEVSFPLRGLKNGEYLLEAEVSKKDGRLTKGTTILRKLPPAEHEVKISGDNFILIDGKPFFPLIAWGFPLLGAGTVGEAKRQGFNTITSPFAWEEDDLQKILDAASRYQIKVFVPLHNRTVKPGGEVEWDWIKKAIIRYRDHPALLGWLLADEPASLAQAAGYPELEKRLKEVDDLLKELDPYHPTWINLWASQWSALKPCPKPIAFSAPSPWQETADIFSVDSYPFEINPPAPVTICGIITKRRVSSAPERPEWFIMQAFPCDGRWPTLTEEKYMAYSVLINGGTGICLFHFWEIPQIASYRYQPILEDLNAMAPIFLLPTAKAAASTSPEIETLLKEDKDKHFLVAANNAKEKRKVNFKIPFAPSATEIKCLREERMIKVKKGEFEDTFEGYGVHVYEITRGGK